MSKSDRNILRYLSIMAIIPKLIKNKGAVSKTADKIFKNINNKFITARALYPELIYQTQDCIIIEKELKSLVSENNFPVLCLTSICLGGLEDSIIYIKGKRKLALKNCIKILFRTHVYYDRKLNKWSEYDKAAKIIKEWL